MQYKPIENYHVENVVLRKHFNLGMIGSFSCFHPPGSSLICPYHSPFLFSTSTTNNDCSQSTSSSTSCTQDLDLVMSDQIVQHPWEQSPPQSPLTMNNPMDVAQLDVVVQMASYLPFDMIDGQAWLAQDVSIMSSTRQANIIEHILEALRGEMGLM